MHDAATAQLPAAVHACDECLSETGAKSAATPNEGCDG